MLKLSVLPVLFILALPLAAAAQTNPPGPPPGCTSAESKQFDFWVGTWEVFPKQAPAKKVADSHIEKLYMGCAVRENWMPLPGGGGGGGSLNAWNPATKMWRQTWLDSSGTFADFTGGWNGTAMVITGVWPSPGHPTQQTRMTYTPLPDGSVEQAGQTSDDDGKTWTPSFDLIYRKAAAQP